MAALPLNQRGIDVNLPPAAPPRSAQEPSPQIVLEYTGDKRLSINKQDVSSTDLEARLREVFESRNDKTLFLMAAGTLRYGEIVQLIDAAKGAGVQRVGVVTESMRRQ
jgi:biopolymer transport protein ExbD